MASAAPVPGKPYLEVQNKGLLTLAIMGAAMIQILDSTIANVAIPHMQTSLGATQDSVTWVLTSYIVAGAVVMPITGWLADRIGSRRLFIWSTIGFIITSMLCGISVNLTEMVIFRVLQGICAAFMAPLSQSILLDINPPERAPKAMAMWGMGVMVAPIFGPMIGGWLTESYNWRWVFYINLPVGIPTVAILLWLLPTRPINRRYFDGLGFGALAIGVATLQLMLDRGQHEDWFESWEIRIEAIIAISALWIFFVHQATTKKPMFDPELVTDRNFGTALIFMVMIGVMMFGVFALLPPMLQTLFGYTVFDTGLLLAPRGIGILMSMMIATRLAGKIDPRLIVGFGFMVTILFALADDPMGSDDRLAPRSMDRIDPGDRHGFCLHSDEPARVRDLVDEASHGRFQSALPRAQHWQQHRHFHHVDASFPQHADQPRGSGISHHIVVYFGCGPIDGGSLSGDGRRRSRHAQRRSDAAGSDDRLSRQFPVHDGAADPVHATHPAYEAAQGAAGADAASRGRMIVMPIIWNVLS